MVISQDLYFHLFFFFLCFSHRLDETCGCHCLSVTFVCRRLDAVFVCRHAATFIYVRVIHTSKVYPISDKKSNQ